MKHQNIILSCITSLLVLFSTSLISSCRTRSIITEVPVVVTKHDTVSVHSERVDSIFLHDSVFTSIITNNDTIYITRYEQRIQYRDRWHTRDSIQVRVDSIPVTLTKTITETKYRTPWYAKIFSIIGGISTLAAIAIILYRKLLK